MMTSRCSSYTVRPDDDVADAGLVFERQEDEAFGRARPLPRDHAPGHAHATARPLARQVDGAQHAAEGERRAMERHRMRADGEAGPRKVGRHALDAASVAMALVHRPLSFVHRHSSFVLRPFKELSLRPDGLLDLPERRAAVVAEGGQRANLGQHGQLVAPGAGLADQIFGRGELARRRLRRRPVVGAQVTEAFPRVPGAGCCGASADLR